MSTRPPKYTVDQIQKLLETYIEGRGSYGPISASEAADWLNRHLSLNPPLSYRDLTRKPLVKEFIKSFNERLATQAFPPALSTEENVRDEGLIDIDQAVAQIKDEESLRECLQKANIYISRKNQELEAIRSAARDRERVELLLTAAKDNYEAKSNECETLKAQNVKLAAQNQTLRTNISKLRKYIDHYLYDEISKAHFKEIRLDPVDDPPNLPTNLEELCPADDDIQESVETFYGDVISTEKADLLDKFDAL